MQITFCGAARTVTGSSHLITLDNGYNILLDCGMYQGHEEEFDDFNAKWPYFDPRDIDCLILSHAHIDHSGRIPRLVKDGFKGKILSTNSTRDLAAIMLLDSAYIQERDAEYVNKKKGRSKLKHVEPLYTTKDAVDAMKQFVGVGYEQWHRVKKGIQVLFRDSGHILGSASITLKIRTGKTSQIVIGFTGDIGRPDRPILRDPIPMPKCDVLISESTYGDKLHGSTPDQKAQLLEIIKEICVNKKGKLIIPAFSIGRTQELVYMMDQMKTFHKFPKVKVYVDSPLAINATDIFRMHPECYDEQLLDYMLVDPNPFGFNGLHYIRKVEDSKKLNNQESCIIISASGMATAGRIRHHIFNGIENPRNAVLIVGYCSQGTTGAMLRDGRKTLKMFGQELAVKAQVKVMDSFSAHGDQQEMIKFLDNQDRKRLERLLLVHGDYKRQKVFKEELKKKKFKSVSIPNLGERYNVW